MHIITHFLNLQNMSVELTPFPFQPTKKSGRLTDSQ